MSKGGCFLISFILFFMSVFVQTSFNRTPYEMLLQNMKNSLRNKSDSLNERYDDSWPVFSRSAEFLDAKDLLALSVTCKKGKCLVRQEIGYRLKKFNEYFVFEEDWFNALVYKILNDNFPSDLTLNSPETRDYTALMVCKYIFNEHKKLQIPDEIYFGIVSFFFEAVFGKGFIIPIDNEGQLIHFLGQQVQKFNLPRTIEYFFDVLSPERSSVRDFFTDYFTNLDTINLLNFLVQKPSLPDHTASYITAIRSALDDYGDSFDGAYVFLYEERMKEPFDDDSLMKRCIDQICLLKPVTTEFFDRLPNLNNSHFTRMESDWFRPFLLKKYNLQSGDPLKDYLSSIDYDNPFSIEKYLEISGNGQDLIGFIMRANMSLLLKLDILKKFKEHFGYIPKLNGFDSNRRIIKIIESL